MGYDCEEEGLDHRWAPSEFSDGQFCSKCGKHRDGTGSLAEDLFKALGLAIPEKKGDENGTK